MDPSAKKNETPKYPEWSELNEINKQNKSLQDLLNSLKILEQNNPKHTSVQERKVLSDTNSTKLKKLRINIWENEDNLPIDENWNEINVSDMWPEWIPEQLNN